jgi:CRP-like cAMP-binding protein
LQDVQPAQKWKKSAQTLEVLNKALKGHFLFEKAPDFVALLDALQPRDAKQGDCIIWEGDKGDTFYILEEGTCSVVKGGNVLSFQQKTGSAFGELALIHNAPRAASIRAIEDCKLWRVDRHHFRQALNEMENGMHETQTKFLKNISLFSDLNNGVLNRIAEAMKVKEYKDGERIIKQGEVGDEFFMIKSGNVTVTQKADKGGIEKVLTKCGPGDYFGELSLMKNEPRAASVTATGPIECFTVDRKNFVEVLGPLQELLDLHKGIQMMTKVKMLSENLNDGEIEKVSRSLQRKICSDGTRIIKQGEKGDLFYMIEKGTVTVLIDNNEVASLTDASPTPYFGEMALISDDIRAATVIADGSVQLAYLTRQNFNQLLGPMKDIMKRVSCAR